MEPQKRFDVELEGGVTIVRLNDPKLHEMILISELHDELLEYVGRHEPRKLLVDFAMVTQCSSAVINSILLTRKRLAAYGGEIRLCSMHQPVRQAFRLLRLDGTLFQIDESLPEALRAFQVG